MPAPRPPILGLNNTGKRRSCAALDISFGLLLTMERGYRRPNLSNSESCSDFDVSIMNDLCPFTTHTQALKVSEVAERIKDCVAVSSQISRGAHSVKEERIPVFTRAWVVRM